MMTTKSKAQGASASRKVKVDDLKTQSPKTLKNSESKKIKGGGYAIGGKAKSDGGKPGGTDKDGFGLSG